MKKCVLLALLALLLTGCRAEETMETISDEIIQPVMAQPGQISVSLPGEAVTPAVESDSGRVYLCRDYEVYLQTLEGGDLNATIQTVTGYEKDALTVMETEQDGAKRYDFVWASAGENGDRLGRGVILDDGNYHYVMTILRDADSAATTQIVWDDVFRSFTLA